MGSPEGSVLVQAGAPIALHLRDGQFSSMSVSDILRRPFEMAANLSRVNPMSLVRLILAVLAPLAASAACAQMANRELPTRPLTAGVHLITAEVADDDGSRELGLMYRRELAPNHGMLFVFDPAFKACMWMRNTLIPLSVAFIDAKGRIVNIEDMQAQTDNVHCARHEVPFALEMAKGWFAERNLKPGETVIGGLPQPPHASN